MTYIEDRRTTAQCLLSLGRALLFSRPQRCKIRPAVLFSGETWADDFAHALDQQRPRRAVLGRPATAAPAGPGGADRPGPADLRGAGPHPQPVGVAAGRRTTSAGRRSTGCWITCTVSAWSWKAGRRHGRRAASQAVDRGPESRYRRPTPIFSVAMKRRSRRPAGCAAAFEELEQQLARRQTPVEPPCSPPGEVLDWEVEKRRILARLEAETSERNRMRTPTGSGSTFGSWSRRPTGSSAEKQAEIEALQQVLRSQTDNLGSLAVGAAAVGRAPGRRRREFARSGKTSAA